MQGGPDQEALGVEILVDEPIDFGQGAVVTDTEDGGALIQAAEEILAQEGPIDIPHNANLADYLDPAYLGEISSELRGAYEADLESRSEWEETYVEGLDQLGAKLETRDNPFEGASAVTHPLISESVIQFQAAAYKEILPSGGPVRTMIVGAKTMEKEQQAQRVKEFMNWQILNEMPGYDQDTDQLLFYLPLSGSVFKKVYFDEARQKAVSKFVPAQDIVVPYSATDLETSPRITHRLQMQSNEIRKLQVAGFYRDDVDLSPSAEDDDKVRDKVDEIQGTKEDETYDETHTLLEIHVELDLEGFEDMGPDGEPTGIALPYIVTIDDGSGEVLSIRRNFAEGAELAERNEYFVHYRFMPGLGFYGFGILHLIGGLGKAATSILRQLIDSGTLANLPGGFKAKGMRVARHDEPIQPGEWRDIDVPGGSIRDSLIPLPYKEPSSTLAALLGSLIDAGRRFMSMADEQIENMGQEAPVGTTMAILERGTKTLSAVHKRLHAAQKKELKLLARVFAEYLPPEYPYEVYGGEATIKAEDFDGRVDVIPVSDPNIFSMAQRVTLAQSQLQLAQTNPQLHNLHAAYRRMYEALGVENIEEVLPPPPQPQPTDPAVENARALGGSLLQAFPEQKHEIHIQMHVAFMKTPLVSTSPQVMGTLYAHLLEHVSLMAREQVVTQIEGLIAQLEAQVQSGQIPMQDAQMRIQEVRTQMQDPNELEQAVSMEALSIQQKLLEEMLPPPADPMSDPLVQIRMREVDLKQADLERKAVADLRDMEMEGARIDQQAAAAAARIESQEDIADERNKVNRERIDVQRQAMGQRRDN
jgi:hypothetical protein